MAALVSGNVAQLKENLSLLRLVHFLSVAFLVANYVKSSSPFFGSIGARQVIQTGRHSLEVYCLSAICSVILNIIVVVYGPALLAKLLLDATAIALILLSAWILGEARRSRKSKEKTGSGDLLSPIQS
ncbi:MAG: OpgC domain-containing protein [Hyphomicrobium sp.]